MRTLETIDAELAEAKSQLANVRGTPTEVYSRIVGYYRSVKNWNRGKKAEYKERKTFVVDQDSAKTRATTGPSMMRRDLPDTTSDTMSAPTAGATTVLAQGSARIDLFVRASCPACPAAKAAAAKTGLPVRLIDADSPEGLEEAARASVYATPTALLIDGNGLEQRRGRDAKSIAAFGATLQTESAGAL